MNPRARHLAPSLPFGVSTMLALLLLPTWNCDAESPLGVFQPFGRLLNISTRAKVGTGDRVLIAGFTIVGTGPKKVVVRAIGPSLKNAGIDDSLGDPVLELHDGTGALIASNDDWRDAQRAELEEAHLAPTDDHESALILTLDPGAYTAIVRGAGDTGGVAVVEVYDGDHASDSVLANVSTRAFTSADSPIIGGVIMSDEGVPLNRVAVRALGPTLGDFGLREVVADPRVELRDASGALVAQNDDWQDAAQRDVLEDKHLAPADEREAAFIHPLGPGAYTAIVCGEDNAAGSALVEFYQLR